MPFLDSSSRTMSPSTQAKKLRSGLRTTSSTLWNAQSPDLNPIENLWTDVKKAVHTCNSTSNENRIIFKIFQL